MPELPEVETMRRGVLGVIGARITAAERVVCSCKPIRIAPTIATLRRRVTGRHIRDVGRVGKRLVLHLDTDDSLVFEPRMTGLVLIADPPSYKHLRFRLKLHGGSASELIYWDRRGLGSVTLYSRAAYDRMLGPDHVGPDALQITKDLLKQRLSASQRAVKVALLDQRCVAGIGNLYASEILHVARVHPAWPCDKLFDSRWTAIAHAIVAVFEEAIRCEGSTLGDGTYRTALNQPGSYQNKHRVYDRQGQSCPRCIHRNVVRMVQAQRSTFFCPGCQRPP